MQSTRYLSYFIQTCNRLIYMAILIINISAPRSECFSSEYYGSCMTWLMVGSDEQRELQAIVDRLNVVWNTWTKWTMDNMLSAFKHFDQLKG